MFPMLISGINEEEAQKKALKLLEMVELDHLANHLPDDLSGGEKQRVAIARALANDPKVILKRVYHLVWSGMIQEFPDLDEWATAKADLANLTIAQADVLRARRGE